VAHDGTERLVVTGDESSPRRLVAREHLHELRRLVAR
jgi:hypothetical protein